jgi:lipoate-protein ligase B
MILDLGLVDYQKAYRTQKEFVSRRKVGEIEDSIIIAEHNPVFTIGRSGERDNLLVDESYLNDIGAEVVDVDRGGDITFHGPGQLVMYPILDLKDRDKDLHKYLRKLEDVCIAFLTNYSIKGERSEGRTGVWVDGKKIASIGIAASDWVTYHGLAINIDPDLKFFSMIHPCGMPGIEVTSLKKILNRDIMMADAKEKLVARFMDIFQGN